jgi:hypothetical protein
MRRSHYITTGRSDAPARSSSFGVRANTEKIMRGSLSSFRTARYPAAGTAKTKTLTGHFPPAFTVLLFKRHSAGKLAGHPGQLAAATSAN